MLGSPGGRTVSGRGCILIAPVHDEKGVTIYWSHSVFVLMGMPSNSVDSIVTDPPYGLSFMGKKWDYDVPSVQLWREALRVLKPGGHMLAFGGSRTYHRMVVNIEDAGFEIRDQIMWLYGSGFPKSLDVSKAIDKIDANHKRRERALEFTAWIRSTGITAKQIDDCTDSDMASHYLTDKEQPSVATLAMFDKMKHLLPDPPEYIYELMKQRTVESENFKRRPITGQQEGTDTKKQSMACPVAAQGIDKSTKHIFDITAPATEAAQQWDGWGTALKPAHEPICVARKPLTGTVAENVLKHGTGGLNIDACRIPGAPWKWGTQTDLTGSGYGTKRPSEGDIHAKDVESDPKDRFPANLILDSEAGAMLDRQSGELSICGGPKSTNHKDGMFGIGQPGQIFNDSGGASRFFYCAKASKEDRDEGLEGMDYGRYSAMGYERGLGDAGEGMFKDRNPLKRNSHPTVKPTPLMQYLVRLVTPPGGTTLDPFMGSGSTGKGAVRENFKFVGIDNDKENIPLAIARINAPAQVELI